VAIFSVV
jgi:hypothetical protein